MNPDSDNHLGSSTFLTDLAGQPYQFVMYLPFGETFAEQRAAGFGTPYLFNAKELDEETGLYYYGARYYDPRVSMWWGVDPLAGDMPEWSPFAYTFQNPVRYIDPTGMMPEEGGDPPGKTLPVVEVTAKRISTPNRSPGITTPERLKELLLPQQNSYIKNQNNKSNGFNPDGLRSATVGGFLSTGQHIMHNKYSWHSLQHNKNYGQNFHGNQYVTDKAMSKSLSQGLNIAGKGLGIYGIYSTNQKYQQGQINSTQQMIIEQGSNVFSTFGGLPGAAWGFGWELGRAVTTTSSYQTWKQETWLKWRKQKFGY